MANKAIAFKPSALKKIAAVMGYKGDMADFKKFIENNSSRKKQMQKYANAATRMAKGGVVKLNTGGTTTTSTNLQTNFLNQQNNPGAFQLSEGFNPGTGQFSQGNTMGTTSSGQTLAQMQMPGGGVEYQLINPAGNSVDASFGDMSTALNAVGLTGYSYN